MNLNTVIIIFIIVLALFFGVIFFQFRGQQGKLETKKVTINKTVFSAEIATREEERQIGLSGRDALAENRGMLFVFDKPSMYQFWMKDMKFPIDIIFINGDKIVSFVENAQPSPTNDKLQRYAPAAAVDKAFEINAGLVKKHGFKKGDIVKVE